MSSVNHPEKHTVSHPFPAAKVNCPSLLNRLIVKQTDKVVNLFLHPRGSQAAEWLEFSFFFTVRNPNVILNAQKIVKSSSNVIAHVFVSF